VEHRLLIDHFIIILMMHDYIISALQGKTVHCTVEVICSLMLDKLRVRRLMKNLLYLLVVIVFHKKDISFYHGLFLPLLHFLIYLL